MQSTTVRISESTKNILKNLAENESTTMNDILDRAVKEYQLARMFEEADAAYAALRNDPYALQQELEEQELWDSTLMDGLEHNP